MPSALADGVPNNTKCSHRIVALQGRKKCPPVVAYQGRNVSLETTELSRSKLQRKDRAQLQIIARAMGGRPEPKARKADIVDMILELAGIGADGDGQAAADSAGNGAAPAQAESTEESKEEQSEQAPPEAEEADAEQADASEAQQDAPAEDAGEEEKTDSSRSEKGRDDRSDGERSRQDRPRQDRDRQDRSRQEGDRQDRSRQEGDRQDRSRQDRDRQDRSRQQDDQPEIGNRRRRRRGRNDRDRPEEPWEGDPIAISGHLDLRDDGYGFLRIKGFQPSKEDAYVSVKQVRQFGLRKGDFLAGGCRPATRNEKNPALLHIDSVNGLAPESVKQRPKFEDLTPLFPDEQLRLERDDDPANMTCRIIDLLSPIGKGQRGLIVSPPKAGKTTIMKEIARSIELNNPEVHLLVLLVDERPEEVTDMRRWLLRGEVAASTFDRPAEEHTHVAEMTIERAKRMVERGEDVVIVLDGITRLSRAYNLAAPATGRIMSGGIDTGALYPPKKFFGAARNVEGGRLAHHVGHCAGGDRVPDGRGHLRGVQGHRQHGVALGPAQRRAAHLSGYQRGRLLHPSRGAAFRTPTTSAGVEAAPGAQRPLQRRQRVAGQPAWSC